MKADASSAAPKSLVADSQTVIKAVEASLEQQLKLMRQLADLEFDAGLVGQRPLASPSPHPATPHLTPLPCLSPRPRASSDPNPGQVGLMKRRVKALEHELRLTQEMRGAALSPMLAANR